MLTWVSAGAAALIYCALSAWTAMPLWESAFASDASAVSWLSGALLVGIGCVSVKLWLDRALPATLALWLAIAIFALALDEQFMLHERWKHGCAAFFGPCAWSPGGDLVRELPMLLVGVAGFATALWLHRSLARDQRIGLWTAIAIGIWAIAVDQIPMWDAVAVLEEAYEVLAEAIFLGVLLGIRREPRAA